MSGYFVHHNDIRSASDHLDGTHISSSCLLKISQLSDSLQQTDV